MLDKLAVQRGGGQNHRLGLYDMLLVKDNHIDFAGSMSEAVRRVRLANKDLELEVEARTLQDVRVALELAVQRIMLDNMPVQDIRAAVLMTDGRAQLEASGNITLETVRRVAETGVDFISVGALTHSARTLDVSFEYARA
jgi:nicotinate-nucleotide pyrophosphorylase (carboxylating)